jgi:hypothetical protein
MNKNQKYKIIDVSNWELIEEGKGYSNSYWLRDTESRNRALFKMPKYNEHYDWYGGGHWAEKIVSEIGEELNLKVPQIDLALYNSSHGCISYRFLNKDEILKEGVDLMSYEITEANRQNYTLNNILSDLKEYDLIEGFIEILLFDGFIGQTDRHEENWGIIVSEKNDITPKLAPIYDNASSLARERLPHHVEKLLKDENFFRSYLRKCKSCIRLNGNEKITQYDMLYYLNQSYSDIYKDFITKLKLLKEDIIREIIFKVPENFMSENQKKLVLKILMERRSWMLDLVEKEGD